MICNQCKRDIPISPLSASGAHLVHHVGANGKHCYSARRVFMHPAHAFVRQQENLNAMSLPSRVALVDELYANTLEASNPFKLRIEGARTVVWSQESAPTRQGLSRIAPKPAWYRDTYTPLVTYKNTGCFDLGENAFAADLPTGIRYANGRRATVLVDHDAGDAC